MGRLSVHRYIFCNLSPFSYFSLTACFYLLLLLFFACLFVFVNTRPLRSLLRNRVSASPWICFGDIRTAQTYHIHVVFIPQQQQMCYNIVTCLFLPYCCKNKITFTSHAFVSFFTDAFEAI